MTYSTYYTDRIDDFDLSHDSIRIEDNDYFDSICMCHQINSTNSTGLVRLNLYVPSD